jgi:imidazoleglycerol phosphate synthase, cyclase subunit
MLAKRIIPCLDVTAGRVVKGTQFVDLKDAGDPIELAQRYNQQGADELVFLDITASSDKRAILIDLVQRCAKKVFIPFTVGGGIRDIDTIKALLHAGADKISINSAAIDTPELIQESSQHFGSQCIVVAIDAKRIDKKTTQSTAPTHIDTALHINKHSKFEIYTHGGRKPTGIDAIAWATYMTELGAGEILLTSMDQDGKKTGYDLPLTKAVCNAVTVPVIASGGAGNCQHIIDVLNVTNAALLASLLHFNELNIEEIK